MTLPVLLVEDHGRVTACGREAVQSIPIRVPEEIAGDIVEIGQVSQI